MITLTEAAKEKVLTILVENNAPILRFGLQGGGCSGFSYVFTIEQVVDQDDIIYQIDDTHQLVVDPMSMSYVEEAVVDYKKELMSEGFVIDNPNVKNTCGCGSSFSVD